MFQEKIFKNSKNKGCGNISPPIIKNYKNRNQRKKKGKGKLKTCETSFIFISKIAASKKYNVCQSPSPEGHKWHDKYLLKLHSTNLSITDLYNYFSIKPLFKNQH